jgi:hypothetical protein
MGSRLRDQARVCDRSRRNSLHGFCKRVIPRFGVGAGSILRILDGLAQISLFGKLKLANCAPISGLLETGLFYAQVRHPACALQTTSSFFRARFLRVWID